MIFGLDPMDMVNGRSIALPGVIAAAILCGTLACGPACAASSTTASSTDAYAFGGTYFPQDYAKLVLQVGGKTITLSDGGFQGWVSNEAFNFTSPDPVNTSYMAGVYNGSARNNFFVFNLASVSGTVTSAKLELYSGTVSEKLNYSLFGATEAISELSDSSSPDSALYAQLGSGQKYGSFDINAVTNPANVYNLILTLNTSAVSDINAIIIAKKAEFAISGFVKPVPEPSTWIMMLAGFAGLGLAGYRRAARGRRAVSAG
jgi:PEP-CTERM motif